jgi:hypothetical protein
MNESGAVAERDFLELVEQAVAWPAPPPAYHRRVCGTHCKFTRLTV